MGTFVGCVILESLDTDAPVQGLIPIAERVVDMPRDPDATVWSVRWFEIGEEDLRRRLPLLAQAMRPHWYAHFWGGDDLCVILSKRFFWAKASDRSTWDEFVAYADTVGVDRKWTQNISTVLPAWVQASHSARR